MAEPTIQLGGGNWAGKTDNLLGYYKEGERFYKQDFTFSRSTTGTYTDSDGYIQEMPYNKLLQSNDFNTSWSNSGTTETSGQSGYDGTNNAWLLEKSQSNGYIYQNISQSSTQTISVYAKSGSIGGIEIYINAGTTRFQKYNLDNGTLIGTGDNESSSIEDVGGGWYRCIVTINDSATRIRLYPTTNTGDKSGTSGSIYIQNAQVNKGTSAKTYFPTTTRLNMPRVDYLNNSNGSLILEPQRTNLITQSQSFDNSYWTKSGASVTSGFTSPDGTNNAYKLVEGTNNGGHTAYKLNVSISSGVNYTYSLFVKGTERVLQMVLSSGFSSNFCNFDLSDGTIGSNNGLVDSNITSFSNGWYRCDITALSNGTSAHLELILAESKTSSRYTTYEGNGTSGVYIYGAQLEQGNYATSLINTSGSSVTRNADGYELTNVADRIGQTEGCVFIDFVYYEGNRFEIFDASSTADGFLIYRSGTTYNLQVGNGGTYWAITNMVTGLTIGTQYKLAINYKLNDYKVYVNGSQTATNTSIEVPTTNKIISSESSGGNKFTNNINQFMMFDEKLTDAELAALTTI